MGGAKPVASTAATAKISPAAASPVAAVGSSASVDLREALVDTVTESLRAGEANAVSALESLVNLASCELAAAAGGLPTEDLSSELTTLLAADPTLRALLGTDHGTDA